MDLMDFNQATAQRASEAIRPCVDIDRWVDTIVESRPYGTVEELLATAHSAAAPFEGHEVDAALSHHPRIGEKAAGHSAEAGLSRGEQSGLAVDADITARLAAANADYEARFNRVFLIRAAGRTSAEILAELDRRMENTPEREAQEVATQLREIALLRLRGMLAGT
ncbi:2-oxo-4-hydroxy-4-carboxy-5-ureidoimidazoline decarboxylase [Arthrobacter sp.]|uniref:2-oxo-4-hydroxy-4-carboxy-5-ureidoimidazoline decarboxylase n=1 Tax=Arthrobacter sp. TaxID=1667 RepID=UPI003A936B6C